MYCSGFMKLILIKFGITLKSLELRKCVRSLNPLFKIIMNFKKSALKKNLAIAFALACFLLEHFYFFSLPHAYGYSQPNGFLEWIIIDDIYWKFCPKD